ncbi:MAG: molybdopterin-dependent oxidoreductase [Bacillota bacterium]
MAKNKKKGLSRRAFLLASGAAVTAGAASNFLLTGCQPKDVKVEGPAEEEAAPVRKLISVDPEVTATKFNVCGVCGAACAMIADMVDGRVWRLRGNPDDQVALGHLCVKGYTAHKDLYCPDRLKYPLKRTNPQKGPGVDPGWVKIEWDEAFKLTADAFNKAIQENGPQSVAFFSRNHDWMDRLRHAIGTPNQIIHDNTCFTTYTATWRGSLGIGMRSYMMDIQNAKYILSFGWDIPSKAKNNQARDYIKALENGAKCVCLNPHLTITASLADEWIPIKPGTDLAFMLAMIRIIINEELYDKDYVASYTTGLDELKAAVQDYTPQWAAEITEVPAATIERIAREFGTTRPAFVPTHKRDAGGPNYANSWRTAFCSIILNALVGAWDREGGQIIPRTPRMPSFNDIFPPPAFPPMPKERIDGFEKHSVIADMRGGDFSTITEAILSEKPYPLKAALMNKYNLLSFPNPARFAEALAKLDFVAVVEYWPSELAQMADVVFPEFHFLEGSGMTPRAFTAYYPQIALREPVHDPLYDAKGFGSIITGIAKAMGLGEYFEGLSSGEFNNKRLEALETSWDELKASPNGLWSKEQPFKGREEWGTPSKKIELYSSLFKEKGFDPLPYWQPKKEMPSPAYPLYMLISRPPMHKMTATQNNELRIQVYPENSAILHKDTAKQLGIKDGDEVTVESRVGKIKLKAQLTEGIRPDCVCVEHGFGHWSKELTIANNRGANEGELIPNYSIEESLALKCPGANVLMTDFCVKVARA